MKVYWLAICRECKPWLPMPFDDPGVRDAWVKGHHSSTGHRVETGFEVDRSV